MFDQRNTMFHRRLKRISFPLQRARMYWWATKVHLIVRNPPGCDDNYTAESIASFAEVDFTGMSTWTIVCEEILDTTFPTTYHQRARKVLHQRGIADAQYEEMRRFAWLTAGWLNFQKMHWDWVHLDESDILRALRLQFTEGLISNTKYERCIVYLNRYTKLPAHNSSTR